jgi:hypothetical protein
VSERRGGKHCWESECDNSVYIIETRPSGLHLASEEWGYCLLHWKEMCLIRGARDTAHHRPWRRFP